MNILMVVKIPGMPSLNKTLNSMDLASAVVLETCNPLSNSIAPRIRVEKTTLNIARKQLEEGMVALLPTRSDDFG